jgi:hypothetical protein
MMVDVAWRWPRRYALRVLERLTPQTCSSDADRVDDLKGTRCCTRLPDSYRGRRMANTHFEFSISPTAWSTYCSPTWAAGGFSEARKVQKSPASGIDDRAALLEERHGIAASRALCMATEVCPYIEFLRRVCDSASAANGRGQLRVPQWNDPLA